MNSPSHRKFFILHPVSQVSKATKTTPESWLYMQAKLDLWTAENETSRNKELKKVSAF
jgi:plasmid maintenance system antidote protein VapI